MELPESGEPLMDYEVPWKGKIIKYFVIVLLHFFKKQVEETYAEPHNTYNIA